MALSYAPDGAGGQGGYSLSIALEPFDFNNAAGFRRYPDAVIVHQLEGYAVSPNNAQPQWGARLGLYHSTFSHFSVPALEDWAIYDALPDTGGVSFAQLQNDTGLSGGELRERLNQLHQAGFVLRENEGIDLRLNITPQESELYVNVTEGCNFTCPGCATAADVIPPDQAQTLDEDKIELFLKAYLRSSAERGLQHVKVKWAGGEPTLKGAWRIVQHGAEVLKQLTHEYPDISISQVLLTNGVYLNSERVAWLKDHDFHVAISLWGTERLQDQVRIPRHKMESYDRIIGNVRMVHEAGLRYNLSYVLTPENAYDCADFVTSIWDTQHPDFLGQGWTDAPINCGFSFYRPNNGSLFADDAYKIMASGLKMGFARMLDMIRCGIHLPDLHRLDYLSLFTTTPVPCGAGQTYLALGAKGVAPCHEGLYELEDNVARINAGENLFDIAKGYFGDQHQKLFSTNIEFAQDDVLAWHGGQGCPRLAMDENDGKLGKASSTEALYLDIYKDMLALEAERQIAFLKQQSAV